MRKAFTLLELIFVLIIVSLLSIATYKAFATILVRSFKAKEITSLSMQSQIVVNTLSSYLKNRVPYSVIGYDPEDGSYEYIGDLTSQKPVLEWFGMAHESLLQREYSGFMDMATKDGDTIFSQDTHGDDINTTTDKKFHLSGSIYTNKNINLIFAGSFDRGAGSAHDYNDTFGWHGGKSLDSFDITIDTEGNITVDDSDKPDFIYEKYFLVDSAYGIARGVAIDQSVDCITDLGVASKDINDTLLLFYNYRPWKGESFCADKQGNTQAGDVAVLMLHVSGFKFEEIDYTLRLGLDINRSIRGSKAIHLSKLKVAF